MSIYFCEKTRKQFHTAEKEAKTKRKNTLSLNAAHKIMPCYFLYSIIVSYSRFKVENSIAACYLLRQYAALYFSALCGAKNASGICRALSGGVIKHYARLNIIAKDIKHDTVPAVLDRLCLDMNSASEQLVTDEYRRNTVHDMISGFFYIVGYHVLKRQHSLNIKISRSGNEIALVRIFTGQLKSDKMTTIIQIFPVHKIVFDRMPTGRLDRAFR